MTSAQEKRNPSRRAAPGGLILFACFLAVSVFVFWQMLKALLGLSLHYDYCSQIAFIPFMTALLTYWNRRRIFAAPRRNIAGGASLVVAGFLAYGLSRRYSAALGNYDALSADAFAMVLVWIGGFLTIFGARVFRAALFPLALLFLMIPIPSYVLARAIFYLQSGSTAVALALFHIARVPVFRDGFVLFLPGLTIEVAKECSSIRSSVALLITCLVASYLYLRAGGRRAIFVLLALPLSVFKNGVRIATLSLLSLYVNPEIMTSKLHRDGGVLFFFLALLILLPVLLLLQKWERSTSAGSSAHSEVFREVHDLPSKEVREA